MPEPANEPPFDSEPPGECTQCGGHRTETFKNQDGWTVRTCADCGRYDDRVDYMSRGGAPWD